MSKSVNNVADKSQAQLGGRSDADAGTSSSKDVDEALVDGTLNTNASGTDWDNNGLAQDLIKRRSQVVNPALMLAPPQTQAADWDNNELAQELVKRRSQMIVGTILPPPQCATQPTNWDNNDLAQELIKRQSQVGLGVGGAG